VHRPFDDTSGFDTEDLHTEGQVAILPASHPLGVRPHVRLAEVTGLPDLPLPRWPRPDGTFADGPGPQVRDHTQLTQLIAPGRACAVVPVSGRTGLREDLTAVPVLDAPPCHHGHHLARTQPLDGGNGAGPRRHRPVTDGGDIVDTVRSCGTR
jgi:DNA-binding transcriptional LysR family regulator